MQTHPHLTIDKEKILQEYNQQELNNFFLEELFFKSLKLSKKTLFHYLVMNPFFYFALVISCLTLAVYLLGVSTSEQFLIISTVVSAFSLFGTIVYTVIKKTGTQVEFMSSILEKSLNIQSSTQISTLDGFLMFIETIKNSKYSKILQDFRYDDLYQIRSTGSINPREGKEISKCYWNTLSALCIEISLHKGVEMGNDETTIYKTKPLPVSQIKNNIEKKQEEFIKSFILNGK